MTNIASNKKAFFEYTLDDQFETGIVLEGWEVKALRAGKAQLTDGYVVIRNEEMFLIGLHITPLKSTSSHTTAVVDRTRKLLLKKEEITRLIGKVQQKGFTIIPLNLHWKGGLVKCDIALAKGKNTHDKRQSIKEREGRREVERVMKNERS